MWQEGNTRNLPWPRVCRGENSERRYPDSRPGRFGKVGRIRYHSAENKFERFRVFLELIRRFDFEFCRRGNNIF